MEDIFEGVASFGSRLSTPMGFQESEEKSARAPVVHPQLCVSENHFDGLKLHADERYRTLEEEKAPYKNAERISFGDVLG